MRELIPSYIYDMSVRNKNKGTFNSSTLFMDISGFTQMTEALMKKGKEGAEVISVILNNIFEPIINAVYDRDGFISSFAGDAMTIIFEGDRSKRSHIKALFSALYINKLFKEKGLQKTRLGDFNLSIKLGLSFGKVDWGIVGKDIHKTYYFRGEAIDGCANSEHHCDKMDIVIDDKFFNLFDKGKLEITNAGEDLYSEGESNVSYFKLIKSNVEGDELNLYVSPNLKKEVLKSFILEEVLNFDQIGEFRDIVSLFISFKEPENFEKLNELASLVLEKVNLFGGYFNVLDFGDKGGTMLVLFGAPISYENNTIRAIKCIQAIHNELSDNIRAGVVSGIVYTGIVGIDKRCTYTALGDTVNMSARFMMKANWGDIWLSKRVADMIRGAYSVIDFGKIPFKGKSEPIQVYKLDKELKQEAKLFEGQMVGRESEVKKLKEWCKPIFKGPTEKNKFAGIFYIYGEPGTGKTRLLYELTKDMGNNIYECLLQVDSIVRKSLNPFTYFFENFFQLSGIDNNEEKKTVFSNSYDKLIKLFKETSQDPELYNELIRIKSIIGSIVDLYWEGSVYSTIEPKDLPDVLKFAIKDIFKALSLIKPTIIILDDIQWIDKDSEEVFQTFTRLIEDYPIILFALSRYNDDGTKPKLILDDTVKTDEIDLSELTDGASAVFLENNLGNKVNNHLFKIVKSKTQNNPFFMEQFCLYLKENELITVENGLTKLKNENQEIPVEINAVLVARIDRLSAELKEAVQMGSVLGREFDIKVIHEMLEVLIQIINILERDKDTIHLLSTRLKASEIRSVLGEGEVEKVWTNFSEIRYIFKHALLMDVVYEMQLKQRLRELHKVAAEAIHNLFGDRRSSYSEIAQHYEKAEVSESAKDYYIQAGDYSKSEFKNEKALEYYNKALALVKELYGYNHSETGLAYNNIGEVYLNKGEFDKALENLNQALDILLKTVGDNDLNTISTYNNIGLVHLRTGEHTKALEMFDKVLKTRLSITGEVHPEIAVTYTNLGTTHWEKGEYDEALKFFDKSLKVNTALFGDNHLESALTYNDISMIHWMRGENDEALKYLDKATKIIKSLYGDDHISLGIVYTNYGKVYWSKGELDKSIEYSKRALTIRESVLGVNHLDTAFPCNNIGMIYWAKGDYAKALEYLNKTNRIFFEVLGEYHINTAVSYSNIGLVYDAKGDYATALGYLDKMQNIMLSVAGENHPYTALAYSNRGRVLCNIGSYKESIANISKSIKIREEVNDNNSLGYDYTYIAYCYAMLNDYQKALEYSIKHLKNIEEVGNDVEHGRTHLVIALVLSAIDRQKSNGNINTLLEQTKDITKISLDPQNYFKYAIEEAEKHQYRITEDLAKQKYEIYLKQNH